MNQYGVPLSTNWDEVIKGIEQIFIENHFTKDDAHEFTNTIEDMIIAKLEEKIFYREK